MFSLLVFSPDGRYIVAMPLNQSKLVLHETATHTRRTPIARSAHEPVWSNDCHWIYSHDFLAEDQLVYRMSVPDGKL